MEPNNQQIKTISFLHSEVSSFWSNYAILCSRMFEEEEEEQEIGVGERERGRKYQEKFSSERLS